MCVPTDSHFTRKSFIPREFQLIRLDPGRSIRRSSCMCSSRSWAYKNMAAVLPKYFSNTICSTSCGRQKKMLGSISLKFCSNYHFILNLYKIMVMYQELLKMKEFACNISLFSKWCFSLSPLSLSVCLSLSIWPSKLFTDTDLPHLAFHAFIISSHCLSSNEASCQSG